MNENMTDTMLSLPDIVEPKETDAGYYIGNIYVDISRFTGEDKYSDGDIEDELLLAAKKGKLRELMKEDNRWPIFYHVTGERENLLNFLPRNKKARVLEIGSGCGGVTGILAEKFGFVETVEISKRRADIAAYRHNDKDNITIHVGNLNDMEFESKFDIITLIGVLEYAPSFTHTQNPFEDFLLRIRSFLAEDGVLIIAIENRLGMKYFSGAKEDHLGERFVGITGYRGNFAVKTFSKKELQNLMNTVGFTSLEWYYPYPDYKIPTSIYSDRQLPTVGEMENGANYTWDQDRYEIFSENDALASMLSAGLFDEFANSFLLFAGNEKIKEEMPSAAHYSFARNLSYSLATEFYIDGDGKKRIVKTARTKEQQKHLKAIEENCRILSKIYGKEHIAKAKLISPFELEIEFVEGESLSKKLQNALLTGKNDEFSELMTFYVQKILRGSNDETLLPKDISPYNANRKYDIDMNFEHIVFNEDGYKIFDYEWLFPKVSKNFILWRSLSVFYSVNAKLINAIGPELFSVFVRSVFSKEQIDAYFREEERFQKQVSESYRLAYMKKRLKWP